jgi:tetratricopeptide (TPR) repeat protein
MANADSRVLPPPSAEQRRAASGQFERANQVLRKGDHDYGIQLLLSCCRLDPGNIVYRQSLRQAERVKYGNNQHGSRLALVTTARVRLRLGRALTAGDYLQALEFGEQVLVKNPWDVGVLMGMSEAFDGLGLLDLAVWSLEQARQVKPKSLKVARALARLYEKRGNFTPATALWEMVRRADPTDVEAQRKSKDLAASETIARGRYQEAIDGTAEQAIADTTEQPAAPSATPEGPSHKPAAAAPFDRLARQTEALRLKIDAEPHSPHAYLQLAGLYRRSERLEEARQVLEQGLVPTGNHFEIALELADLAVEPFRADLARTEEKLRRDPSDESLHRLRAGFLREITERELDLYRRKADRYPTDMAHRFEVGLRLLRLGQTDEAIQELQAARADPRQHCKALFYLGHCFKARNNWRLAQRNFEEALKDLPPAETAMRKDLLFELAQGNADAGNLERAVELGMELANLDFAYRGIGQVLDDWQARLEETGSRPS